MLKRLDELLLPVLALIFSVVYVISTRDLAAESTIFPRTVMFVLCLLGAGVAISELLSDQDPESSEQKSQAPLVFVLTLAYVLGFWLLGFAWAAPVFLLATMVLLGQPLLRSAIVSVVLPLAVFVLFSVILDVKL
jgi:hypothetical protein